MDGSHPKLDKVRYAAQIYEEHGAFIKKVIEFKVKNKALADDLYQDFFLTLIRKPLPNPVTNIRGFLYNMVTHDILDATRRLMLYRQNMKKYAHHDQFLKRQTADSKESGIASEHVHNMLKNVKIHISPREEQALRLRFQEHCGPVETATRMGVKPQTVNRYVSMGLDKIRQTLEVQDKG